jgi:hypothetical protein
LDCRHVCKTCAFYDAFQEGKQKEVHCTPLIWRPQAPDQGRTRTRCYWFGRYNTETSGHSSTTRRHDPAKKTINWIYRIFADILLWFPAPTEVARLLKTLLLLTL